LSGNASNNEVLDVADKLADAEPFHRVNDLCALGHRCFAANVAAGGMVLDRPGQAHAHQVPLQPEEQRGHSNDGEYGRTRPQKPVTK
jgi:hypothetical protein